MTFTSPNWGHAALVATVAVTLSACDMPEPIAATQVDRTRNFVTEGLVELEPTPVTTYQKGISGRSEVKGVRCAMKGPGCTATFITPAVVLIPEYGQASPLPAVTCAYDGQSTSVQAKLQNRTEVETTGALANAGGLVGLALGGIISGTRTDKSDDRYAFWPIEVEFTAP